MAKILVIAIIAAVVTFFLSAWSSYSDSCEDVDNPQSERFGLKPKVTWSYSIMFAVAAFLATIIIGFFGGALDE